MSVREKQTMALLSTIIDKFFDAASYLLINRER